MSSGCDRFHLVRSSAGVPSRSAAQLVAHYDRDPGIREEARRLILETGDGYRAAEKERLRRESGLEFDPSRVAYETLRALEQAGYPITPGERAPVRLRELDDSGRFIITVDGVERARVPGARLLRVTPEAFVAALPGLFDEEQAAVYAEALAAGELTLGENVRSDLVDVLIAGEKRGSFHRSLLSPLAWGD